MHASECCIWKTHNLVDRMTENAFATLTFNHRVLSSNEDHNMQGSVRLCYGRLHISFCEMCSNVTLTTFVYFFNLPLATRIPSRWIDWWRHFRMKTQFLNHSDREMSTVHFCCNILQWTYYRSQSHRAAIIVYKDSYSEPLLHLIPECCLFPAKL